MKHNNIVIAFGLMLAALTAAPAYAAQRVYVASQGDDANNCTLPLPCHTLQRAIAVVVAGGEVAILSTGGYNAGTTVTIDKAVNIVNEAGFEAGLSFLSGVPGIVINAGPTDAVSLVGLTIEGAGVGTIGIQFNSGQSLTVKNCVVRHMGNGTTNNGTGILFTPSAGGNLFVSDTVASDNGYIGIFVSPTGSGTVSAVFNHVETNNNHNFGVFLDGLNGTATINGTIADSVASGNTIAGFRIDGGGSAPAQLMVFHSVAANNGNGLSAFGSTATLRLASSVVTGNATSWNGAGTGGVLISYGDNYIDGNGDGDPGPTVITRK
jgi:hypothetical protein